MSQDIEIDPDSRTIKYYEKPDVESVRLYFDSGGSMINWAQAKILFDEIDRLRKENTSLNQSAKSLAHVNHQLQKELFDQNQVMQDLFLKAERLEKLVPPESERGPGFVGQGSWSVFAEKVVEERDAAREQIKYFIAQRQGLEDEVNRLCDNIRSLCAEKEEAQERVKQHLEEKIELRDELSYLCEEIRILKEENDELRDELEQLGAMIASKKEHTNTHFNDKKDFVGIDGYGRFSVQKANDCLWILNLPNETVTFYNRKGRRVCANHVHSGDM